MALESKFQSNMIGLKIPELSSVDLVCANQFTVSDQPSRVADNFSLQSQAHIELIGSQIFDDFSAVNNELSSIYSINTTAIPKLIVDGNARFSPISTYQLRAGAEPGLVAASDLEFAWLVAATHYVSFTQEATHSHENRSLRAILYQAGKSKNSFAVENAEVVEKARRRVFEGNLFFKLQFALVHFFQAFKIFKRPFILLS